MTLTHGLAPCSTLSELVENYCNEYLCDDLMLQHPVPPANQVRRASLDEMKAVVAVTTITSNGPNELGWWVAARSAASAPL